MAGFKVVYLLLVGIPICTYGLVLFGRRVTFLYHSRKVYGRLTGWKASSTRSKKYWYPEVSYATSDGVEYQVTGAVGGTRRPKYEVGHPLPVRYDTRSPDQACVCTFLHLWAPALGFLFLGGGAITAAVLQLVKESGR